jgi:ABC-type phosphonate transport system ATPase subunit
MTAVKDLPTKSGTWRVEYDDRGEILFVEEGQATRRLFFVDDLEGVDLTRLGWRMRIERPLDGGKRTVARALRINIGEVLTTLPEDLHPYVKRRIQATFDEVNRGIELRTSFRSQMERELQAAGIYNQVT